MSDKNVLFMARTTRFHEFVRTLGTTMGAEVFAATPDSPGAAHDFDLLVLDATASAPTVWSRSLSGSRAGGTSPCY